MSCLLKLVKAYTIITSLFQFDQSFYVEPSRNNSIVGTTIEYKTPINNYHLTFYRDNEYAKCFVKNDMNNENTAKINIQKIDNQYTVYDPTLLFNMNDKPNPSTDNKELLTDITIRKHNATLVEQCKQQHPDYFNRNWFTKIFHVNPCKIYETKVVPVHLDTEYGDKCIIGNYKNDNGNDVWNTKTYILRPFVTKSKIVRCASICFVTQYNYFGVDQTSQQCKCSMVAPSSMIELDRRLCQKCKDVSSNISNRNCGNKKHGFVSVYKLVR
jgi:hypothetical protein